MLSPTVPHYGGTSATLFVENAGEQSPRKRNGDIRMATQTLERRETSTMIGSDKVEGTNVYQLEWRQDWLDVERIMLDKQSGKVAYAVMSFGGFLGIGSSQPVAAVGVRPLGLSSRLAPH